MTVPGPDALPCRIRLVVGDWSRDGHSQTEDVWVRSNRDQAGLKRAYAAGSQACGVDLTRTVCVDYCDGLISGEAFRALCSHGLPGQFGWPEDTVPTGDPVELDPEAFATLWVFVARLGDPGLECALEADDAVGSINIGGYGLFVD